MTISRYPRTHALLALLLLTRWAAGQPVNHTIDDQNGDSTGIGTITYAPSNQWSQGVTCKGCLIHLDPSQTFDGTWHDTTFLTSNTGARSMEVKFTGTAVYVFNALANTLPPGTKSTTTNTHLLFTLDGEADGSFDHTPSSTTDIQYQVLVYAHEGLPNANHTLLIQANPDVDSVILFDFVQYTLDSSDTSEPSPLATNAPFPTLTSGTGSSTQTSIVATTANLLSTSLTLSLLSPSETGVSASSYTTAAPVLRSSAVASSPKSTSDGPRAGVVAGATIGGIAAILLLSILAVMLLRRRVHRRQDQADESASKAQLPGPMSVVPNSPLTPPQSVIVVGNPLFTLSSATPTTRSYPSESRSTTPYPESPFSDSYASTTQSSSGGEGPAFASSVLLTRWARGGGSSGSRTSSLRTVAGTEGSDLDWGDLSSSVRASAGSVPPGPPGSESGDPFEDLEKVERA